MNAHELKVYPYHCAFLKDFPELAGWLDCNGYFIMHSHQDFRMKVIYTFWSNQSAATEDGGAAGDDEQLVISYCQVCKTVEVYHRAIIATSTDEKQRVGNLARSAAASVVPENECRATNDDFPRELLQQEIETLINETNVQ